MEDEEYRLMMEEKSLEDDVADTPDGIDDIEPEVADDEIAADEKVFDENVGNEGKEGIA